MVSVLCFAGWAGRVYRGKLEKTLLKQWVLGNSEVNNGNPEISKRIDVTPRYDVREGKVYRGALEKTVCFQSHMHISAPPSLKGEL